MRAPLPDELVAALRRARRVELVAANLGQMRQSVEATGRLMLSAVNAGWKGSDKKDNYKIAWMCALLGVARSSFYAWCGRVETSTTARRRQLAELVTAAFDASRQVHGCRRIARDLNDAGHDVAVGTIASIMRELGLKAMQPRATSAPLLPGRRPCRRRI